MEVQRTAGLTCQGISGHKSAHTPQENNVNRPTGGSPNGTAVTRVTRLAVAIVALVAAIVSYQHMQSVAAFAGEGWVSYLLPLAVDGLVVAASLAAWRSHQQGEPVSRTTKISLAVGLGVSLAANIVVPFLGSITPTQTAWLAAAVAAYPAVALALSFEQMLQLTARSPKATEPDSGSVDADAGATAGPELLSVPVTALVEPVPVNTLTPRELATRYAREHPDITGKALGARFSRSDGWGRQVLRAVRAEQEEIQQAA